ncbi:MAG: hypothetical protein GWN00_10655, partial [Aliifodinibius sp.]|nr:hypothetical protein [Fodinibius sp.]NIW96780.1 hypothetical protein [Phycisphaerae bacterium]NIY25248.1 hypothetical protein [Fodinibius sp.]
MTKYAFFLMLMLSISGWVLINCSAPIARIPASGVVGGQDIETTVDSESARYYLEQYLQEEQNDAELDSLCHQVHCCKMNGLPQREFLKHLSDRFSVDYAALYLAKRILENKANRRIQAVYKRELESMRTEFKKGLSSSDKYDSAYVFLFVPGWDYVESGPNTGADFARPREILTELGIENYLIEFEANGSVERSARIVADEINHDRYRDRKIILVSASSGGPTAALALGSLLTLQQTSGVKAWLNIGGILRGSPVVDYFLSWPKSWLARAVLLIKGWDLDSIRSMSVKKSRPRFNRLHFPEHLLIINYVGIPLSGDITELAKDKYSILREFGPNDGLTLITDALVPSGLTVVELGRDHFFNEDPEIDLKTVALTR